MKRSLLLLLSLFLGLQLAWAQEPEEETEKQPPTWQEVRERLFFQPGGSFFIANSTMIVGVSPSIGYRIFPSFSVGVGPSVLYVRNFVTDFDRYEYGGSAFARQRIGERFFAQVEYEQTNRDIFFATPGGGFTSERQWVPGFLVGGGYFQQISQRSGFIAALFYNLLYDPNRSNTASPLVTRFGFVF